MKRLLIVTFGFISLFVNAQNPDNSLLWKISGNGLSQPSYLFGTVHITCDATLSPKVNAALDATRQLYLELDMDDPNMMKEMMGGMTMKDGVTMTSLLSTEDYKLVEDFIKSKTGMPLKMLDSYKPFLVSAMLMPAMLDCKAQSIEQSLIDASKKQNEEIFGLETVQEQLHVFDAIPYKEQMEDLLASAKDDMANDRAEYNKMMELYNAQKLNELMAFMKSSKNKTASHDDVLLINRNKNWIPRIEKIAKEKPTLFGVGAGHLGGENGVIMLLRKKGYKVEAVK
ncbi:TraB/GumN family protein [Flavobacterium suzhouense]|uniref:TraB/GumN family protein n=1 Tax=Flavobacterium suzhouense TaxID=1529638 RepID=A0ABW5NNE6_9FLAO